MVTFEDFISIGSLRLPMKPNHDSVFGKTEKYS